MPSDFVSHSQEFSLPSVLQPGSSSVSAFPGSSLALCRAQYLVPHPLLSSTPHLPFYIVHLLYLSFFVHLFPECFCRNEVFYNFSYFSQLSDRFSPLTYSWWPSQCLSSILMPHCIYVYSRLCGWCPFSEDPVCLHMMLVGSIVTLCSCSSML